VTISKLLTNKAKYIIDENTGTLIEDAEKGSSGISFS